MEERTVKKLNGDYVCVYTTHNEHNAELVKIGLEGQGIPAMLQRKGNSESINTFMHEVKVFVSEDHRDKAIEFLKRK